MEDALFITYPRDDVNLHFTVDLAPVPVLLVDASRRIAALNKRAARLFKYESYELQMAAVDMLIPERLRDGRYGLLGQSSAQPFTQLLGCGREVCCRCKDGSEVLVEVGVEPFEAAAGSFALVTVIDISERRRIEALRSLTAEIRREALAESY